jgi:hypothetical protein
LSPEMAHLLELLNCGGPVDLTTGMEACHDLDERLSDGESALYHAVLGGRIEHVEAMLARGADPNFRAADPACDILAPTPLDLAKQARFLMDWDRYHRIARLLEAHGAKDIDGHVETAQQLRAIERRARSWKRPRPRLLGWIEGLGGRIHRLFAKWGRHDPWVLPGWARSLAEERRRSGADHEGDLPRPPR